MIDLVGTLKDLEVLKSETAQFYFTNLLGLTKSNLGNFDHKYDFNGKVIVIGLRVKRSDNFILF